MFGLRVVGTAVLGFLLGMTVGDLDGLTDGANVGDVGFLDGLKDGRYVGAVEGAELVGRTVGEAVGTRVGAEGATVGFRDGRGLAFG